MQPPTDGPQGRARHVISIADLCQEDILRLARRGAELASDGTVHSEPLHSRIVGLHFRHASTRTRTAFSTATLRLGGSIVAYGPSDLQRTTGETALDTGEVLSGMLDAFVTRTAGDESELREYAVQGRMPVINAMSASEHPTQALADLATMLRHFGKLNGIGVRYIGEGNNTAAALALALAHVPAARLHLNTPPGYGVEPGLLARARGIAAEHGSMCVEHHDMTPMGDADVVYTTQWQTTGTTKPDPDWRRVFEPFRVDGEAMAQEPDAVFMHDLPARRGDEVTGDVLDGPRSIAMMQAHTKVFGAMAVLEYCLLDPAVAPGAGR